MKLVLLILFLSIYTCLQAQLSKRFRETTTKYFIALPVKKNFSEWLENLRNSTSVAIYSLEKQEKSNNILFLGRLNEHITALPKYDSAILLVGQVPSFFTASVNGAVIENRTGTDYYLQQTFYFSNAEVSEEQWNSLIKAIVNDFKKSTSVVYPTTTKNDPFNNVWFQTDSFGPAVVMMRYGKAKEKPSYILSLQLAIR